MRVLMVGRGVIASVYGWALERAGHDVEFFVRPGRTGEYGSEIELDLLDLRRRLRGERVAERWPVRFREELTAGDGFDLVVVSVAHDRLAAAAAFLAPRVGQATVLVLGNVAGEPAAAVDPLPIDQVVWGFPGAGGGFQPGGRLRAVLLPSVRLGALSGPGGLRDQAVRRAFREAGMRVREQDDIAGWFAIHLVLDAGIFAQGLRLGSVSALVGRGDALRQAFLTSSELLPVLAARGIDLRRHRGATTMLRHPRATGTVFGWATRHVAAARFSLEAHADPAAAEPRAVCRDVLRQAHEVGVAAPRLEAAVRAFAD